MKRTVIVFVLLCLSVLTFSACSMVDEMPTVPMATITPTPANIPSAMPTEAPSAQTEAPILPTESIMPDSSVEQ